jgi:hypothetical protein
MKADIDSILLVNNYLLRCTSGNPACEKTQLTRKYLTHKISKTLKKRQNGQTSLRFFNLLLPTFILRTLS